MGTGTIIANSWTPVKIAKIIRRPVVPSCSYHEEGAEIPSVWLTDMEYGHLLQCVVRTCTDVVPIDRKCRVIYLADRISKPMTGLWFIGGGMKPKETPEESVERCFARETRVELPDNRFRLVMSNDYLWKDRQQEPQTIGCHMKGELFVVELSAEELAYAADGLDPKEYNLRFGLQPFNREKLVAYEVHPVIIDLYDLVMSGKLE